MGAWVLNTSENLGGKLREKTEECDRYLNIPQDRMQEWCRIVDPHFLLLPFHTQIIMGCIVFIGTYSQLFEASLREKSKKVLDLLGLGSQDDGEMPQETFRPHLSFTRFHPCSNSYFTCSSYSSP
jgi:hypothetical protein